MFNIYIPYTFIWYVKKKKLMLKKSAFFYKDLLYSNIRSSVIDCTLKTTSKLIMYIVYTLKFGWVFLLNSYLNYVVLTQ